MARKKAPAPVLVVDSTYGITGLRKSGGLRKLPGGVVVVSALAGPKHLPDDLIPSEIHFHVGVLNSPFQVDCRNEVIDILVERMPSWR